MGRSKSMDFSPEEFQKLSREERKLRGRMSSLLRMIKRREESIEELMKPVKIKLKEIEEIKEEFESLKGQIKNMGFDFPSFRVESYITKGKSYYRGVWYVDSKKFQHYIGSEKLVQQIVWEKYPNIKVGVELDKVLDCFLKDLQLSYWNKQYEGKDGINK
jgi:seryl-tRNA synthetase